MTFRRWVVGACVLVMAGLTAPAARADTAPSIIYAGSVNNDLGRIVVSASAPSNITSLTVHVVSPSSGKDLAVVTAFKLISGTAQYGTWNSVSTVHLNQLGSYPLTVRVRDAAGDTTTAAAAGNLIYEVATSFTSTSVTPKAADYAHRTLTVAGRLLGRWPGDGSTRGLTGYPVQVMQYSQQWTSVVTGPDGWFSAKLPMTTLPDWVDLTYSYDSAHPDVLGTAYVSLPLTINPSPTRISAQLARTTINIGEQDSVSGQLTWKSPTGWRPFAGQTVAVQACPATNSCYVVDRTTTDAAGRYHLTFAPTNSMAAIRVGYGSDDPFVAETYTDTGSLLVRQLSQFDSFWAGLGVDGVMQVGGHLNFPAYVTPGAATITIQYSASGTGSWTTVATLAGQANGTGFNFSTALPGAQAGYWRAIYAGDPEFLPSTSSVVRA